MDATRLPPWRGKRNHRTSALVFTYGKSAALREGTLKIIRGKADQPWELYDLASDPGETKNLAAERADDVKRLDAKFQEWLVDVKHDASEEAAVIK